MMQTSAELEGPCETQAHQGAWAAERARKGLQVQGRLQGFAGQAAGGLAGWSQKAAGGLGAIGRVAVYWLAGPTAVVWVVLPGGCAAKVVVVGRCPAARGVQTWWLQAAASGLAGVGGVAAVLFGSVGVAVQAVVWWCGGARAAGGQAVVAVAGQQVPVDG